jgi:hypothetical protein
MPGDDLSEVLMVVLIEVTKLNAADMLTQRSFAGIHIFALPNLYYIGAGFLR